MTKALTIAFDARQLNGKPEGMGVYLIKVVEYLLAKGHEVYLLSDQKPLYWRPSAHTKQCHVVARPRRKDLNVFLSSFIWQEIELRKLLETVKPDVYHAPANEGIPELKRIPSVLTMHDLSAVALEDYYGANMFYKEASYGLSVNRADKIICISKYTERDLLRLFPEANGKTILNYNGVDVLDPTRSNPYADQVPYIVYNGRFSARKNVDVLIRAFAQIAKMPQYDDFRLLLLGSRIKIYPQIRDLVEKLGLADRVTFTGFVPTHKLGSILHDAHCSIYPSRYEGFGLPPLEAMTVGCPVIVSHNTSLIEVVNHAGLMVPTGDENAIVEAFVRLTEEHALRQRLIQRGYKNIKRFTWNKHGAKLVAIYRRLVQRGKRERSR